MQAEDTLDYHIKSSWHSISRMYNMIAAQYDLTQATGYALISIDEKDGVLATQIGPLMGMEPTGMSRLLTSMEKDGLIIRKRDDGDARKVNIFLTDLGIEKRKIAKRVIKSFNRRLLDEIGERDFLTFRSVTERIQKVAEEFKEQKSFSTQ